MLGFALKFGLHLGLRPLLAAILQIVERPLHLNQLASQLELFLIRAGGREGTLALVLIVSALLLSLPLLVPVITRILQLPRFRLLRILGYPQKYDVSIYVRAKRQSYEIRGGLRFPAEQLSNELQKCLHLFFENNSKH